MAMLRIGICDDSADARCALAGRLEQVLENRGTESSLLEFSSGEGLIGWMERHAGELDLVFLDVEMGGMSGMDTAKALHGMDPTLLLAFVTGYADFVFDGYGVGAIGYVLKPAQADQLDGILGRALERMHRDAGEVFLCRSGQTLYRIPRASILYFESDRRKLRCVTTGRTYEFYGRLDEVERQLDSRFVRIHQRYLVRCAAVERAESGSVTIAGETLPVSRACQAAALAAIARASLEG